MTMETMPFVNLAHQSLVVLSVVGGLLLIGGTVAWWLGRRSNTALRVALREERSEESNR